MPGPIPNRSGDYSRARDVNRADRPELKRGEAAPVSWPAPDPEWGEIPTMLYYGAMNSGQAEFYQQSDIAWLWSMCEDMHHYKQPVILKDKHGQPKVDEDGDFVMVHRRSPEMLKAIISQMQSLMFSEAERRRARIELDPPENEQSAELVAIDKYRARLEVAQPPIDKDDE